MSSTSKNKPGRPRDESLPARRQEEILDAAARLFAERGYAEADVDSLAALLEVGKGTIYRYFPSKRELFLAAVDRGMQRLGAEVNARVSQFADPLERITEAIRAYLAWFDEHPEMVELFIQERAQFKDRQKPTYFAHHEANIGPWREMYRQLVAEGRVRDLPLGDEQDVVNDLLYGTILANYITGRRIPHQIQARHIIDIIFQGILTDDERTRRAARSESP
jgi:AcrR family transcriptional regulator